MEPISNTTPIMIICFGLLALFILSLVIIFKWGPKKSWQKIIILIMTAGLLYGLYYLLSYWQLNWSPNEIACKESSDCIPYTGNCYSQQGYEQITNSVILGSSPEILTICRCHAGFCQASYKPPSLRDLFFPRM